VKASLKRCRYAIHRVEAGEADAPVVLFDSTSGRPVSSCGPDLPGFGFTEVSEKSHYNTPSNGGDEFHSEEGKIIPASE
jgi:hypothetical protein